MQVAYNGHDRAVAADAFANLGEALDDWTGAGVEPEVLVRLVIDGEEIEQENWDACRRRACRDIDSLEIESRPLHELARSSVTQMRKYCGSVGEAIDGSAAHLRAGRLSEGLGLYAHLLDALAVLTETIDAAAAAIGDEGASLAGARERLEPWLVALLEAQEAQDNLLIADYLEYEIGPLVREWSRQLRAVDKEA